MCHGGTTIRRTPGELLDTTPQEHGEPVFGPVRHEVERQLIIRLRDAREVEDGDARDALLLEDDLAALPRKGFAGPQQGDSHLGTQALETPERPALASQTAEHRTLLATPQPADLRQGCIITTGQDDGVRLVSSPVPGTHDEAMMAPGRGLGRRGQRGMGRRGRRFLSHPGGDGRGTGTRPSPQRLYFKIAHERVV